MPVVTERKRCEQCGRVGTRGFKTVGGFEHEVYCGPLQGMQTVYIREFTVCAATKACRRRRPDPVYLGSE